MMRKTLLFLLMLGCYAANSQDTLPTILDGKYRFNGISVYSESNKYEYTTDDLNLMYDVVKKDLETGFLYDTLYPTSFRNQSISFIGASIVFTKCATREIELSLNVSSQINRKNNFVYDRYLRADTIPDENHQIYIDSAFRRFQYVNEDITTVNLHFRKIHRTNPHKSFIAYGGFGISTGYSVVSQIKTHYEQGTYLKYNIDNEDYFNFSNVYNHKSGEHKTIDIKKSLFTRIYIPFGINLAFSTEDSFFRNLHIDIRSGFGFEHQQVFGGVGYMRSFYTFGLGLRYSFVSHMNTDYLDY